jgi:hypothetical protein
VCPGAREACERRLREQPPSLSGCDQDTKIQLTTMVVSRDLSDATRSRAVPKGSEYIYRKSELFDHMKCVHLT